MVLTAHTAPGQTAGVFFQVERALYWLASSGVGAKVGIETCDDITLIDEYNVVLEQDKHSNQSKGHPLGDTNVNLWKTLKIWLDAFNDNEIDLDKTQLFIVTNKKIPKNSLAYSISQAEKEEEVSSCITNMRTIGNRTRQNIIKEVLKYDNSVLGQLIKKVSVLDKNDNTSASQLHEAIISKLHIHPDINSQDVIHELIGWIVDTSMELWRAGEPAWITREAFDRQFNNIIWRLRDRQLGKELAKHLIPVSMQDIREYQGHKFVRQLKLINIEEGDDDYFEAIKDFIRCNAERNRLSREGHVVGDDFISFDGRLKDRWAIVFRKKVMQLNEQSTSDDKVKIGIDIYYDIMDHREPLAGRMTEEFYLTRGSYHRLADSELVGWHPDYAQLIREGTL